VGVIYYTAFCLSLETGHKLEESGRGA